MSEFKKGQPVKFKTNQGRAGEGVVDTVTDTIKGKWVSIKEADGKISKARPVNVSAK